MALSGDSGEYDFLTEAVALSAAVEGMTCEIGLRAGLGSATIMDAICGYCPGKTHIGVDPYGSILYQPREHMEPCRLDYTNEMYKQCMIDLYSHILGRPVEFVLFKMTDRRFFNFFKNYIPRYEINEILSDSFSMVHLDGPHSCGDLEFEIEWFNDRMLNGATLVIDDWTPDFVNFAPVEQYLKQLGWEELKRGLKKSLWRKL